MKENEHTEVKSYFFLHEALAQALALFPKELVEFRFHVQSYTHTHTVFARFERVKMAIFALLDNALIATEKQPSPIIIKCFQNQKNAQIQVIDHGIGIAAHTLPNLGRTFFSTWGRDGLGIFLAKAVLRQSKGTLVFNSQLGIGTIATLSLPLEENPAI